MKIAMLTISDWAGSGFKTAQAINRHTSHEVHLIALKGNRLGHPRMDLVSKQNIKRLQKIVDHSDIVHLKGDWPPRFYDWVSLRGKPIVLTVCGGFFRKKPLGQGRYKIREFKNVQLLTAMTPDLCYTDKMVWTPHPVDSVGQPNLWEMHDPPVFTHSPSDRRVKDTAFILKVFAELKKKINFEVNLIEGVDYEEAVELRKRSTIFFDQFKVGFYGNSAIEAMQYGIPVCSWISDKSIEYYKKTDYEYRCILGTDKKVYDYVDMIHYWLTDDPEDLQGLSLITKAFCNDVHSYQSIAKLWDKLYKTI